MSSLTTKLAYAALLPAFVPAHLALGAGLKKAFATARSAPRVPSMLARDATTHDLPTAKRVDPPVELDYLEHRSAAYVSRLALASAWEAARALTGESAAIEPTPAELVRDLMSSAPAFLARRTASDGAWEMDLTPVRRTPWFDVSKFEITRFVFDDASSRYELHDTSGRVHTPKDATWIGAQRKFVAELSVWVPLEGHAWTHFWLPDVVAATVHESIPRDTNLYRLLAPHTRFAARHNHAGLWVQRASNNAPGAAKRLVPWYAIPIRAEHMRGAVMRAAAEHHEGGDHFTLPARLDRRVPYFDFLVAYYEVVEAFVDRVAGSIEPGAYAAWAREVDGWYPGFAAVDMRRALAVCVWQLGAAHAIDHLAYARWARRYGTSEIDTPIDRLAVRASAYDRYRFLAFFENFVVYRPPPSGLDLRLASSDVAYGFASGSEAERAARAFVGDLRALDERLAASGNRIVPLDEIIRAICF